jgi:hypothetical protein
MARKMEKVESGIIMMHRKGVRSFPVDVATDVNVIIAKADNKLATLEQLVLQHGFSTGTIMDLQIKIARCRIFDAVSSAIDGAHRDSGPSVGSRSCARSRKGSPPKYGC